MPLILVEREFDEPVNFACLQHREDEFAWCLEAHDVSFLRAYVSRDRRGSVCMYEAPDAEAVRRTQQQASLPMTRVWAPYSLRELRGQPPLPWPPTAVVIGRTFSNPMDDQAMNAMIESVNRCAEAAGIDSIDTFLARDGMRSICICTAPDAETVRNANRVAGVPFDRVWSADFAPGASAPA